MARRGPKKPKQPKVPRYELINDQTVEGRAIYKLVRDLVAKYHHALKGAAIAAVWMVGKKADKDGRLILGRMRKRSELDRELGEHDLILLLNKEQWRIFNEEQRAALVDHELCHADEATDPNGEPKEDAKGRKIYRMRKHDIEEFAAVVRRHGMWKADLSVFAEAMAAGPQTDLFARGKKPAGAPLPGPKSTAARA